jgi:AcrR family transcriptional regulator
VARTAAGGRRGRNSGGAPQSDADRIIDAALGQIATEGWRNMSLASVASAAGLPILRVYRLFGSKYAILRGLYRRVDELVLADPPPAEAAERPRDRLFDLLMRRFDSLRRHRPSLEVLGRELWSDPVAVHCAGRSLLRSMRWMLEAADISTGGWRGTIAVRLTAVAYLSAMRVWQRDETPDLAPTMSALDARLRWIESWLAPGYHPRPNGKPAPA